MKNKKYSYVGGRFKKPEPEQEIKVKTEKIEEKKENVRRPTRAKREKREDSEKENNIFGFAKHDEC